MSWQVAVSQTQSEASDTAVTTFVSSQDQAVIVTLHHHKLIINVPLISIVREVIFYAGITHNRRFRGVFGPLEKPREIADYLFCQHTKNNITNY
jgi:hypothetical protein